MDVVRDLPLIEAHGDALIGYSDVRPDDDAGHAVFAEYGKAEPVTRPFTHVGKNALQTLVWGAPKE